MEGLPPYLHEIKTKTKQRAAILNIYLVADVYNRKASDQQQHSNLLAHFVALLKNFSGGGGGGTEVDVESKGLFWETPLKHTYGDKYAHTDPLMYKNYLLFVLSPMLEMERYNGGVPRVEQQKPDDDDDDNIWNFFRDEGGEAVVRPVKRERNETSSRGGSSNEKVSMILKACNGGRFPLLDPAITIFNTFMLALDVFAKETLESIRGNEPKPDLVVNNHTHLSISTSRICKRLEDITDDYNTNNASISHACSVKLGAKKTHMTKCAGGVFEAPFPASMDHRGSFDPSQFKTSSFDTLATVASHCHVQALFQIGCLYQHTAYKEAHREATRGITIEMHSIVFWRHPAGSPSSAVQFASSNPFHEAQAGSYSQSTFYNAPKKSVAFNVFK